MQHGVANADGVYVICMYIRLSSEDDDIKYNSRKDESNSITAQRTLIYEYINTKMEFTGCKILERCDDGFSGTHFDTRPQFTDMIDMAKRHEINCIIVKDFSRFGRDYIELGDYMEQFFPAMGIRFISINDNYDSDLLTDGEIGGLDVSFKNLIYDYYARETSKKEKLSWIRTAKKGEYRACVTVYGYRKSRENHSVLEIDPEAAKVVREIFDMKLAGMTCTEIAYNLNAREILSPSEYRYSMGDTRTINQNERKCYWECNTVQAVLQNEKYTGDMVQLKTYIDKITGKQIKRPKDEWITVENTHEAIVSREEFETVRKSFRKISRSKCKNVNVFYCAECGRKISNARKSILRCPINSSVTDDKKCVDTSIRIEDAEVAILEDIKLKCKVFIDMKDTLRTIQFEKQESINEKIQSIERTLKYNEAAWKNLYSEYADRKISKEEYKIRAEEYKKTKHSLQDELSRLKSEREISKADHNKSDKIEDIVKRFLDADKLTNEMKKVMIDKVLVYSNNVLEIHWKANFINYFDNSRLNLDKEKADYDESTTN